MHTEFVLNYPVHVGEPAELAAALQTGLEHGHPQHVVTLNPEMLMSGEADPAFGRILKQADLILPDGAGLVWALNRKKCHVRRIPGIEFSESLIAEAARTHAPVALIGADPTVNDATKARLTARYPGLNVVYAHHGFFGSPEARQAVARACADTHPRLVLVALGVPAQERWITEFKALFTTPAVFVGVGGSFDIWSGMKKRAHPLFLKLNLEWLYRITREPFRIRRVAVTLPMFVIRVLFRDNRSIP